ncbi:hypothetical protein ACFQL1_06055 [Halomicroarcula sp. GCM10025709]|uniref:DUF7692 domain-containing protein n=1 Tax=Haloarcula TaxID=2237 RepID=UPI0024C3807D|nr:hypothetical protein [Halomicroarcula sp. YJ-61-S]
MGDVPGSIRIRCGEENAHRYHAVEEAAEFYGCNRSDAVAFACDNVPALVDAIEEVLEREDLTIAQKQEIAAAVSVRGLEFEVDEAVGVDRG